VFGEETLGRTQVVHTLSKEGGREVTIKDGRKSKKPGGIESSEQAASKGDYSPERPGAACGH